MARSNQGGTRGFLRGKVANDLYQVTKSATGKKIQLVRSVEEGRVNNNTVDQACARMRMALLMGALSDLKEIVDHSFEGIPYGQLSIAHFVKVNMPQIIRDQVEHWNGENLFYYPDKGVKQIRMGTFYLSSGSLMSPSFILRGVDYLGARFYPFQISIGVANPTFGDLKNRLGLSADDYITLLMMSGFTSSSSGLIQQRFFFYRLYFNDGIDDGTLLNNNSIQLIFRTEGNTNALLTINQTTGLLSVDLDNWPDGLARETFLSSVILSRWTGSVWARNNAQLLPSESQDYPPFEEGAPRWHFATWFDGYDPDADDSDVYPGRNPIEQ